MSNLLSSALNTDYRNVRVVKSIPKKIENFPKQKVEKVISDKKIKDRNKILLAFGGLAVLGIASMLVSDSKKAKNIAQEAMELVDEAQILYGYTKPIKENSQKIFDVATEFVVQTVKRIKQGCDAKEFILKEDIPTKISCLTEQGQKFVATCTKKADDIVIDSIEWHKIGDKIDVIQCDSNNIVTKVFSDLKQHENLFSSFSSFHLFKDSKLDTVAFDVIKEKDGYKVPTVFRFEYDVCSKIGKNCVSNLSGSNATIEKVYSYENGIISECAQNLKKTPINKNCTIDFLFSYKNGEFSNYQDFLSDRVGFLREQLDMLIFTFFSVFDDIF